MRHRPRWRWDESAINRDDYDGDVTGYCRSCGYELDLLDGAIYDCPRCDAVLREIIEPEEGIR